MTANKDALPPKILIADDEKIFNYGFKTVLESLPDLDIEIETVSDSIEAVLEKVKESHFDALLLDLDWFGEEKQALKAIQELKETQFSLSIIAISAFPNLIKEANKQEQKANVVLLKRDMTPERLANILNNEKAEQK